jgi:predicted RNA-binding protein with PUA-like domain
MNYWLIKSEGDCYSIDDLKRDKTSPWSGVRNFQARNYMRDSMKVGDLALFYHSSSKSAKDPIGVYGIAKVSSKPYADPTAFDKNDEHYDPISSKKKKDAEKSKSKTLSKSEPESEFKPTWILVDFLFVKKFSTPFTLHEIKIDPELDGMIVRQKGSRLSIQPVSEKHFTYIVTSRQ